MNEKLTLARGEEQSLAYLQACGAPLIKDLICKEALVNIGLSQAKLRVIMTLRLCLLSHVYVNNFFTNWLSF